MLANKNLSRRNMLKLGLGSCLIPTIAKSQFQLNRFDIRDSHFFLHVYIPGGMDASYLFDARPRSFTQAGKIQNFYPIGRDSVEWTGNNGSKTLVSSSAQKLTNLKDYFSVINGIHMSTSFDGHEQNTNFLFSGNPFGGDYFLPYFNKEMKPLDYISIGSNNVSGLEVKNAELSLGLDLKVAQALVGAADQYIQFSASDPFDRIVNERISAIENLNTSGLFSGGSKLMREGLASSYTVEQRLGALDLSELEDETDFNQVNLKLALKCFGGNVCNSATFTIDNLNLDAHANSTALTQAESYDKIATMISQIINTLRDTPFDEARGLSFYDVTTFVVGSEFSRTMRQMGKTMENTGTDHNTLGNSMLIGGKKIRTGNIIGATDLDRIDASGEFISVSDIHKKFDNNLIKMMGRPYDFRNQISLPTDTSPQYDGINYITVSSVVNTLLKQFNVPSNLWRKASNVVGAPVAPTLDLLLS